MVATEIGLLDHRYAPFGSSARYRLAMLMYPWQVLRGVELRADTFRLWAREHRTRWSFRLHHPHFEAATESADLGQALCDLARVCAVMAEPFGVPAGRVVLRGPRRASGRSAAAPTTTGPGPLSPDAEASPVPTARTIRRTASAAVAARTTATQPTNPRSRPPPPRPAPQRRPAGGRRPVRRGRGADRALRRRPRRRSRRAPTSRTDGCPGSNGQTISIASPKLKNR